MLTKAKILIITNRSLASAPRVIREIAALKSDFEVTVYGEGKLVDSDIRTYDFNKELEVPFFDKVLRKLILAVKRKPTIYLLPFLYLKLKKILKKEQPDIVIIHEPDWLVYLKTLKSKLGFKVTLNAHEYYPLEFEDRPGWMETMGKYYDKLYDKYLHEADLLINVCDSIRNKCIEVYNKDSIVIPNAASFYENIKVIKTEAGNPIRMIHHGSSIRERRLEIMIEAVEGLGSGYQLDLMLVDTDKNYHKELEKRVIESSNVRIVSPVPFNQIVPFLNQYDVGVFNLPPNNFNYKVALPNKLFEFIQARLAILISPSIEMKKIVEQYDLGYITQGFSAADFRTATVGLNADKINKFKENAHSSAGKLSAECYNQQLLIAFKSF
ncbi:glycosyltransferase family 4 protein [Taibaiella lutea]|uniref:Glycosyltransferase family 4 protein n=1 Tax=Taibaiella lutea TaxID=2608001 RepID=A0A5M6CF68_9BACT|nr:glycosyltransferase [Taibaiella lutea]KAA5533771.1 glycosyltransferase family 4 protein [Taibaiella lutea]